MYIEAYNSTVIRDITVNMTNNADSSTWDVNINSYFSGRFAYAQAQLLVTLSTATSNVNYVFDLNDMKTDQNGDIYKSALIQVPLVGFYEKTLFLIWTCVFFSV